MSARTVVDRPAAQVWALVADYDNDPRWRSGVATMDPRPRGIVEPGTRTSEQIRVAGRTWRNDGEVVAVEPGVRFTWRTTSGVEAEGERSVEVVGDHRCIVRLDITVQPRGAQRLLVGLGRILRRNLTRDLTAFRHWAESSSPAPSTHETPHDNQSVRK